MKFNRILSNTFLILLVALGISTSAQVRMTGIGISASATGSAFIDGSSNNTNNITSSIGKGLVFPRVDLNTFTFGTAPTGSPASFPGRYDGMIIYNTATGNTITGTPLSAVTPGFYFYENKSATLNGGTWKPLSAAGAAGTAGSVWRAGTGAPLNTLGVDGDYYLNSTTCDVLTRTAGAYVATGTNLKGAAGAAGTNGTNGTNGLAGAPGSQGPIGNTGATGPQGATGLLPNGAAAGNTPYWDGSAWVVNSSNVFNNGGNVGIGTTTPATSAILDLTATDKGLLLTRVANTAAITTPVNGMAIYDISTQCIKFYQNNAWSDCLTGTSASSGGSAAVSAYDCFANSIGILTLGVPVSGVTQTITATVTTVGSYSITATANGVTFVGAGVFASTGDQDIILTASGTPTAVGTNSFALSTTPGCSFSRNTVQPSTNEGGVVSSYDCNTASAGTMTVGTLVSGVTQTITATVTTVGTYNILATANGVIFSGSGTFSGTGAQTIVLTGTGIPTTAGANFFALNTTPGCSFSRTVSPLGPVVSALDCAATTVTGTLTANTAASGVFASIDYTGGNGFSYNSQLVSSTGVTGLVASLNSGTLTNGAGGVLTLSITGTPNTNGVASFAFNFGGVSCSFSVNVNVQAAVASLTCGSTTPAGSLISGTAASGVSQSIPYVGGNGANYPAASFPSSGVSGLTANLAAGSLINGSSNIVLIISGTPSTSGTATFNFTAFGSSCSFTRSVAVPSATITGLTCASAVFNPSIVYSTVAYTGSFTVPYTGGNSLAYSAGTAISSTGVTGLTATLQAGTLTGSTGNLTYTVTGTPASAGTASFALSFGGQSCPVSATIVARPITAFTCGSAVFSPAIFTSSVAYSGSATVPYTGGNGTSYAAGTAINSTGVTGLTATLQAGTLANGGGNLTYTIVGTPSANGTASFAISFGGQNCTIAISSTPSITSTTGKIWMDRNLGATRVATSATDHLAYGGLYQWGRNADGHQRINWTSSTTGTPVNGVTSVRPNADQAANALFITINTGNFDWRGTTQNNNLWQGVAGINNPCPADFRLPTLTELSAEVTAYNITNGATAFTSPLKFSLAGTRNVNGVVSEGGANVDYWSSTVAGSLAGVVWFGISTSAFNYERAIGFSVRCIRN